MSVVCPAGHTSQSEDYCDVCGAPIEQAPVAAPAPAPAATGPAQCPNCQAPAASGALFCENCGYDFTTGSLPTPLAPPVLSSPAPAPAPASAPEPATATAPAGPAAATDPAPDPDPGSGGLPTPAVPGPEDWVAEIWIDPEWYDVQKPEDPLPSAGLPVLVPLRARSLLVGRPSVSRNIHPQIDCGADTGVSRRHCQLNTDGQRWWVEDLQSSNGTFVSRAGEPLPTTPIPAGQRHELQDGDRVYVGAWTRIVVRRALEGEA